MLIPMRHCLLIIYHTWDGVDHVLAYWFFEGHLCVVFIENYFWGLLFL